MNIDSRNMQGAYTHNFFQPNLSQFGFQYPQPQPSNMGDPSYYSPYPMCDPMRPMPMTAMSSGYSFAYQNIQEILYSEPGDGEIFVYYDTTCSISKMVTCIDISTLFKEKRVKAIAITNFLAQVRHPNVVQIYSHQIVDEKYIFIEMEVPQNIALWKTFCKKKFQPDEVLNIIRQIGAGLEFLHSLSFVHRDVHPSRFQQFPGNIIKFNPIGLPYNFKKLLKRDNFSGHINYSAPELILEKTSFNQKVDVWSLGCSLYYLVIKKDPFDGPDPNVIKRNILSLTLDPIQYSMIPVILKPVLEACFIVDENIRPTSSQLMQLLNAMPAGQRYHSQLSMMMPHGYHSQVHNLSQKPELIMKTNGHNFHKSSFSPFMSQSNSGCTSPDKKQQSQSEDIKQCPLVKHFEQQMQLESRADKYAHDVNHQYYNQKSFPFCSDKSTNPSTLENESIKEERHCLYESDFKRKYNNESYFSDDYNRECHGNSPDVKHASLNESVMSKGSSGKSIHSYQEIKVIFNDEEGNIYEGEMFNNKKHGKGKQIFPNGNFYEGQWRDGYMEGEGKLVLTTGEIYLGEFVKGKRHGKGKLIFTATGDVYEGDWYLDKMTGKGKYMYSNGKVFEGEYVEGAPYGYGILSCPQFYYEGYFKSGLFEGHGRLRDYVNNQIFEGEYYDGKRRGYGRLIDLKTQEVFEGIWREDKRNGPGRFTDQKNGFIIEGIWENDEIANKSCVNTDTKNNYFDDDDQYQPKLDQRKHQDNLRV